MRFLIRGVPITSAGMAAPGFALCGPTARVGTYTGNARQGEGGDLVVFEPVVGQVYGYGQKDYRSSRSMVCYAKWDGSGFVRCDKLGRELKA